MHSSYRLEQKPKTQSEMSSLISCDAVLNRSKILVPQGTSILLQFLVKIRPNLAKMQEDRTKTASQLINELASEKAITKDLTKFAPEKQRQNFVGRASSCFPSVPS